MRNVSLVRPGRTAGSFTRSTVPFGAGQIPVTSELPAVDAAKVTAITSKTEYYRNRSDEVSVIPEVFHQAQALTSLGDRPLAVVTASVTAIGTKSWVGAEDQLAALSANSVLRTVHSTHQGLLEEVRPSAASVRGSTRLSPRSAQGCPFRRADLHTHSPQEPPLRSYPCTTCPTPTP